VPISNPTVSDLGNRNEITTLFGSHIQGMYIKWMNSASATPNANTAMMGVEVEFHWYNNEIDTKPLLVNTPKYLEFNIEVLNPDPDTYVGVLKDVWNGML
jgi:hypothetical protein